MATATIGFESVTAPARVLKRSCPCRSRIGACVTLRTWARSRAALQLDVLALRHQLQVLQRSRPWRLQLTNPDRCLWIVLSRVLTGWRAALVLVKPETVIAWHRRGFRRWWAWKSRRRMGRPTVPTDVRTLIRMMANANPRWGAPRIHGELLKLGIDICQATVAKHMIRRRQPPSQTWRTFLPNHSGQIVDRASDGGLDGATTSRRISLGRGASMSESDLRAPAPPYTRFRELARQSGSYITTIRATRPTTIRWAHD